MAGAGFTVDLGSLSRAVSQLRSLSDSLQSLSRAPDSASGSATSAMDDFIATSAIGSFGQTYSQALAGLSKAVDEDAGTLNTNLTNYLNADTGGG